MLFAFLFSNSVKAQNLPGSGNATSGFDPAYIDLPNFPQLQFPITIMTWMKTPPSPGSGVFPTLFSSAQSTSFSGYVGYWLAFNDAPSSSISISIGNGGGCFHGACRRTYTAPFPSHLFNSWVHVAVVMQSAAQVSIYINGISSNLTTTGNSNINSISYPSSSTNTARLGASQQNILHRYYGQLDEFSVWNTALTEPQVREFMCKKIPTHASSLVAYYNFDEENPTDPVLDASTPAYNGSVVGGSIPRVPSGAYIGDESDFSYNISLFGSLTHANSSGDSIFAAVTPTNIEGIHIYTVNERPNHVNGFTDPNKAYERYYGYFVVQNSNPSTINLAIDAKSNPLPTSVKNRSSNAAPNWNSMPFTASGSTLTFDFTQPASEFIFEMQSGISVNLFEKSDIRVFPNPSHGVFSIENIPPGLDNVSITVSDVNGKIIKKTVLALSTTFASLDLSNIESGTYFLHLSHSLGQMTKPILIIR